MNGNDLRGHGKITARLAAALAGNIPARAYLFHGPEGVGKFAAARWFARAANCAAGAGTECGACSSCVRIGKAGHPDVHVIDEGYAAEIKIEKVRELQQEIVLRPYEGRYKVFIINDAHNLNPVAANALLKTLEDTPARSVIVLVTDKPAVLPATVVSRCRRENFRPLGMDEFSAALAEQGFDAPTRGYLAYSCEGRLGPALRLKGARVMQEKNAVIDRILSGTLGADEASKRDDVRGELAVMAAWFRDVYVTKLGLDSAINSDRKPELERCARKYGFNDLERVFDAISASFLYLEQNVNTKLLLANLQLCLKG